MVTLKGAATISIEVWNRYYDKETDLSEYMELVSGELDVTLVYSDSREEMLICDFVGQCVNCKQEKVIFDVLLDHPVEGDIDGVKCPFCKMIFLESRMYVNAVDFGLEIHVSDIDLDVEVYEKSLLEKATVG